MDDAYLLEVDDLKVYYPAKGGKGKVIHAVDGVSFRLRAGESIGLAGESGSGKTTTAKALVKLIEPTAGTIRFEGRNITHVRGRELKQLRARVQMVFQDPYESLNPRYSAAMTLEEPLAIHGVKDRRERRKRAREVLDTVGLRPAEEYLTRFPHEMSGGQRQRLAIARAMVLQPKLLVADEPVSMLDVSIRAGILNLLDRLIRDHGMAGVFISHDLSLIRYVCDRTAIMYLGRIVEIGPTERVIRSPKHPYTQALLEAVPDPLAVGRPLGTPLEGEAPSPIDLPTGCRFWPRCKLATDRCRVEPPRPIEVEPGHLVECHLYEEGGAGRVTHTAATLDLEASAGTGTGDPGPGIESPTTAGRVNS